MIQVSSFFKVPNRVGVSRSHLKMETDIVFEMLFSTSLELPKMDKVLNPIDSECYTPSSEPVRFY
jgi:hypothetical protein